MKKNIAVLLILLLVLILTAGCGGQSQQDPSEQDPAAPPAEEDKSWSSGDFAAADIDILTSDTYYIKFRTEAEFEGQTMESVIETAKNGTDVVAITTAMGMVSAVVLKEGAMYIVDHTTKTVLFSPHGMTVNKGAFPDGEYVFKGSGSAEFFGAVKKYEEYSVGEEDVRFFFEDSEVIGFASGSEEETVQFEFLEISDTVPAGIFDIPEDYDVTELQ
jgi:hypothetical protein